MDNIRLFKADKVPRPYQQPALPAGSEKVDVEIGCGVGFHPINYAKKNPDRFLVAIEKTTAKFKKFQGRLKNHPEIKNILPVHTNAIWWITHNLKSESVDNYFILYPNPYPKDHQKRFFIMPFMRKLIETLKPNGTITLATNEFYYFEEARIASEEIWGLKIIEASVVDKNSQPRTHFEKKYLKEGQICFNLVVKK